MTKTLAIIIPVFNGLNYTKKCLGDLYAMISSLDHPEKAHVIVSDDGSTDGTSDWIQANYPQTIVLKGNGSLWWSGGINLGMQHALGTMQTEYVLWWNNDIEPAKDYLQQLFNIINTREDIKVGGSKIYYAHDRSLVWSMGGVFDTNNGRKHMIGMDEPDMGQYENALTCDWLPGMGTFIHKSVFYNIGLVDAENFPQYHGDSDFTYRAHLAGYDVVVFPQLKIWNDKSNSGLLHRNSYSQLIRTLHDIKSNYHLSKDIKFYRKYSTSTRAYGTLVQKYCYYIGGFVKWKVLSSLGVTKKKQLTNE